MTRFEVGNPIRNRNHVLDNGEIVAMATSPAWATAIVDALNASHPQPLYRYNHVHGVDEGHEGAVCTMLDDGDALATAALVRIRFEDGTTGLAFRSELTAI